MAEEKLLTVREVASLLGVSEKEVVDLAESGAIPAYKVGGVYLRFKREQVKNFRRQSSPVAQVTVKQRASFKDGLSDFFYFNDFYILSALLIILLLLIIFQGN